MNNTVSGMWAAEFTVTLDVDGVKQQVAFADLSEGSRERILREIAAGSSSGVFDEEVAEDRPVEGTLCEGCSTGERDVEADRFVYAGGGKILALCEDCAAATGYSVCPDCGAWVSLSYAGPCPRCGAALEFALYTEDEEAAG